MSAADQAKCLHCRVEIERLSPNPDHPWVHTPGYVGTTYRHCKATTPGPRGPVVTETEFVAEPPTLFRSV